MRRRPLGRPTGRAVAATIVAALATLLAGGGAGWGEKAKLPPRVLPNPNELGRSLPARLPFSSGKGGTYWVDAVHGSDRNRHGTRRHPWRTLNRALASVPLSGSVIKVLPGVYASVGPRYALVFGRHGDVRDPVTIEAVRRGKAIITNGNEGEATIGGWIHDASGLRVEGLRFLVLTKPGESLPGIALQIENSRRIEIDDCIFNNVAETGLIVRGGAGTSADDIWIIDNRFRPLGPDPTALATGLGFPPNTYYGSKGSHWIYAGQYADPANPDVISGSRRLVIVNNVFAGTAAGRDVELGPQARNSYVVDNTFYGNRSGTVIGQSTEAHFAGQGVAFFANTSSPAYATGDNLVANNVFVALDGHAVSGSGPSESGNLVVGNLFWAIGGDDGAGPLGSPLAPQYGESTIFTAESDNLVADPRLQDAGAFIFRPAPDSPLLRRAIPAYSYPYDAAGQLRPRRPAIGALEPPCRRAGC